MSGAAREKDQADFDLDRFIDMFDEAMTSSDPRVIETLRSLMMIVTLTRSETHMNHGRTQGPLRRLFEDMHHLNQRMHRMEEDLNSVSRAQQRQWPKEEAYDKYSMVAAAQMAQSIDDNIMKKLAHRINKPGGTAMNAIASAVPPAGKLYK